MNSRIEILQGDITKIEVDAIVNAANASLLGGGGVDGAIHHAAGRELEFECRTLHGCKTGEAKITQGYKLPCKRIIHTVGPVWNSGSKDEETLLANCYRNSFALALKHDLKSIAFPAISTGIYRFPLELATKIAFAEAEEFLASNPIFEKIVFVCFDSVTFQCYQMLGPERKI